MGSGHKILFLGYGYVAQYFCANCQVDNLSVAVSINSHKKRYFESAKEIVKIDFRQINAEILDQYDDFVISIPPFYELKTDIIIDKFYDYFFKREKPYKLIYLSATSVYGDHEGAKVSEKSLLKAKSNNGLARIACEKKYLALMKNNLANIIILRLAGIYGPYRNNISAIANKEIRHNHISSKIVSRTHVADISNIIKKIILSKQINNEIFNIADNYPCKTSEVNDYICEHILDIAKLEMKNQQKIFKHSSFALDNKIVDNKKMLKILEYKFIFPSYKEGLNLKTAIEN